LSKLKHNFTAEKSGPKIWAASAIITKPPKVNNSPRGENATNLVTLFHMYVHMTPTLLEGSLRLGLEGHQERAGRRWIVEEGRS
jgi:hypothetical protein